MSSSTSAQRSSKSSIDSYDEYMDEYSYSSSMEEDTAHNCVEMTKPMGLALEGLNLVSLLFFFIVDQPLLIPLLTLFFPLLLAAATFQEREPPAARPAIDSEPEGVLVWPLGQGVSLQSRFVKLPKTFGATIQKISLIPWGAFQVCSLQV